MRYLAPVTAVFLLAFATTGCAPRGEERDSPAAQTQERAAKAVDPVCNMALNPDKAGGRSEYKGKTYYFCSDYCKKTFDANPEAVLNKQSGKNQ